MTTANNTITGKYSKTTYLVLCGLFAAVTAIGSFVSVPLGFTPVPVNLATMAVFLTGGLLGAKYGTISEVVYVLIGAVGVPVFAGFRGGISVLAGLPAVISSDISWLRLSSDSFSTNGSARKTGAPEEPMPFLPWL